jgi:hypothetical protein
MAGSHNVWAVFDVVLMLVADDVIDDRAVLEHLVRDEQIWQAGFGHVTLPSN